MPTCISIANNGSTAGSLVSKPKSERLTSAADLSLAMSLCSSIYLCIFVVLTESLAILDPMYVGKYSCDRRDAVYTPCLVWTALTTVHRHGHWASLLPAWGIDGSVYRRHLCAIFLWCKAEGTKQIRSKVIVWSCCAALRMSLVEANSNDHDYEHRSFGRVLYLELDNGDRGFTSQQIWTAYTLQ